MADRKAYFGSFGPFPYDDAAPIADPDGDFAGVTQKGLACNGQMYVEGTPTDDYHVLRKKDVAAPTTAPADTVESETSFGISPDAGDDTDFSRANHTHGSPAQGAAIADVPTDGSANAADNATAINAILALLRSWSAIAT